MHLALGTRLVRNLAASLALVALSCAWAFAAQPKLPLRDGQPIVASVEGEPITLRELDAAVAAANAREEDGEEVSPHGGALPETEKPRVEQTPEEVLQRLIDRKLFSQEARRIGLDELPEVQNLIDVFGRIRLRALLIRRHVENLEISDEEIEPFYKNLVREFKIGSLLFKNEEDADKFKAALEGGGDFGELARKELADGRAEGSADSITTKIDKLVPEFATIVAGLRPGEVGPVAKSKQGFAVLALLDLVFPEGDAESLAKARELAIRAKQAKMMTDYLETLKKKHAKVDYDLLASLDFEAPEPGFEALKKDPHVIATFDNDSTITVADLTEALRQEFYHGIQRAIEAKKVNRRKDAIFDEMLRKRVMRIEALLVGIDKSDEYKDAVNRYAESVIFGAFIQKVVQPEVKVTEKEVRDYYDQHSADYSTPAMLKSQCIVFDDADSAKAAMDSVGRGTELSWLKVNAPGQFGGQSETLLDCDGKVATVSDLQEGVREALAGAHSGDYRLYSDPEGRHYLFFVEKEIPSEVQPFKDARESVTKAVADAKLNALVEKWSKQLRDASEVEVY